VSQFVGGGNSNNVKIYTPKNWGSGEPPTRIAFAVRIEMFGCLAEPGRCPAARLRVYGKTIHPCKMGPPKPTILSGFIPSGKPIYNHGFFIGFVGVITTFITRGCPLL